MNKKYLLIGAFGIFICISFALYIILSILNSQSSDPNPTSPSPTPVPSFPGQQRPSGSPQDSQLIPTTVSEGRIDTSSPAIDASTNELTKILPHLDYKQELTTSNGKFVDIVISRRGLLETPWILPVSIGGVKFQVPSDDPGYEREKQAFLETSQFVFDWLKSNGVAVEKIYIRWGDRSFIQERAEEWLNK